tara:strand:+ start:522 stop:794 length:273 start_codon:yes stop_codon:yes gene_type:complete
VGKRNQQNKGEKMIEDIIIEIKYSYDRNPALFEQILKRSKPGKALERLSGDWIQGVAILKGSYKQQIEFLKKLNSEGIYPDNKLINGGKQ